MGSSTRYSKLIQRFTYKLFTNFHRQVNTLRYRCPTALLLTYTGCQKSMEQLYKYWYRQSIEIQQTLVDVPPSFGVEKKRNKGTACKRFSWNRRLSGKFKRKQLLKASSQKNPLCSKGRKARISKPWYFGRHFSCCQYLRFISSVTK